MIHKGGCCKESVRGILMRQKVGVSTLDGHLAIERRFFERSLLKYSTNHLEWVTFKQDAPLLPQDEDFPYANRRKPEFSIRMSQFIDNPPGKSLRFGRTP